MTLHFKAHFQNGVLVPDERIDLPENQSLSVTVDEATNGSAASQSGNYNDPNDPMPEGGPALVKWWSRHRLQLDPKVAQDIAESDEYIEQDAPDEPA